MEDGTDRGASTPDSDNTIKDSADAAAETRRQALRRMGTLAAYTAPALLAMLTAANAQECSRC